MDPTNTTADNTPSDEKSSGVNVETSSEQIPKEQQQKQPTTINEANDNNDDKELNDHSEAATEDELPDTSQVANGDDLGHASDSTLSDADNNEDEDGDTQVGPNDNTTTQNGYSTESETSDVEMFLDDIEEDYNCKWEECDKNFNSATLLTHHFFADHFKQGDSTNIDYVCRWQSCSLEFGTRGDFISHIRSHTRDLPYYCPHIECLTRFASANDLAIHLKTHDDFGVDKKYRWQAFINEIVATDFPDLSEQFSDPQDVLGRYKNLNSAKLLKFHVQKPKFDFLKVQNVQVDDILSEQVKRKGRVSNSLINVELRNEFKIINDSYRDHILTASEEAESMEADVVQLPSLEAINAIDNTEELHNLHQSLERKLLWGLEVQTFLKKDLDELQTLEKELWRRKELLLQTCMDVEIPKADQDIFN